MMNISSNSASDAVFRFKTRPSLYGSSIVTRNRPCKTQERRILKWKMALDLELPCTEEPHNSAFQGTCWFYALSREMPYCQYLELKSIWGLRIYVIIGGFSLLADALLRGSSVYELQQLV